MRWCTECNQGFVEKVRVKETNDVVLICEECDSLWLNERDIGTDKVTNFYHFMQGKGLDSARLTVQVLDDGRSGPTSEK
jgi:hypothetical protein